MSMLLSTKRQSGRTSKQMIEAPKDAVFIWCNTHLEYPKELAKKLKRTDLRIEDPSFLHDRWRGLKMTGIVADHALDLTGEQYVSLLEARIRIRNEMGKKRG